MDTPVLISHKTAWLVHHAPQNLVQSLARHDYQIGVRGISTQQRVARIRQALTDCGIPSDMLKTIDISVVFEFERIRTKGVICHILGQNLPYEHIDELTPGIFITDEAFTFVLAAEWMDRIEYLEYGYEVCGDYMVFLSKTQEWRYVNWLMSIWNKKICCGRFATKSKTRIVMIRSTNWKS